uniref:Uncharacterized protein n=1 Tax=Acrobeloides nanus TaxID=290746 RepID=A0A914CBV8_9BILA
MSGVWGNRHEDSAVNLYTLMAKYRCCCGACRLRVGGFIIAIVCLIQAIGVITTLCFASNFFNPKQMEYLMVPAFILMGFELISSFLMLIGILMDHPYLLLPFQFSCILNMMGSMGMGLVLLVTSDKNSTQIYPAFAAASMALVAIFLWFLVIASMTYVMLRDKKRLTASEIDFNEDRYIEPHMERVFSAEF